jgi:8-oxo-dGTP diphosphatase
VTPDIDPLEPTVTIVVDVANVMGARADGWWRDRAGAAARLCREISALADRGIPPTRMPADSFPGDPSSPDAPERCFPAYVLVLEGRSREAAAEIGPSPRVQVIQAPAAGDDAIVRAAASLGRRCVVVTADRELRRRCEAAGASVTGPGWILGLL